MANYIECDKCKEFVEYNPKVKIEGGVTYTIFKCPKCGYEKKLNASYIHYGLDGK